MVDAFLTPLPLEFISQAVNPDNLKLGGLFRHVVEGQHGIM